MEIDVSAFHSRLLNACHSKQSYLCVGIDPRPGYLPQAWQPGHSRKLADSYLGFAKDVIDSVADLVPIIKPQSAFFEALGYQGVQALENVCTYAHSKGLLVLGDVKRGDIGTTAQAYAQAAFREVDGQPLFDAVTVNPYLGSDGVTPFITEASKCAGGVFVLCKTSNPSSSELQDKTLVDGGNLHDHVASLITEWGKDHHGMVGAVVGGTHPDDLPRLRSQLPSGWILIPGVGAQGATYADTRGGFDQNGEFALVSASRSITFPWLPAEKAPDNWREMIRTAAQTANTELNSALRND